MFLQILGSLGFNHSRASSLTTPKKNVLKNPKLPQTLMPCLFCRFHGVVDQVPHLPGVFRNVIELCEIHIAEVDRHLRDDRNPKVRHSSSVVLPVAPSLQNARV